jgi:hypothetical protein
MDTDEATPAEVPDAVLDDFERIRATGYANMFMLDSVLELAIWIGGCESLVAWVEDQGRRRWPDVLTAISERRGNR